MIETWRTPPGWEGLIEVSDLGRIRTLDRVDVRKHKSGSSYEKFVPGRTLDIKPNKGSRYPETCVKGRKVRLHVLVAAAFLGPPTDDTHLVRHLDDNPLNNIPSNLAYGTTKDNSSDRWRNGKAQLKTHCKRGHEFTDENTHVSRTRKGWLVRKCRTCNPWIGRETVAARNKSKTHCKYGHVFDEQNTYYYTDKSGLKTRRCKECSRENVRRGRAKRKAAIQP